MRESRFSGSRIRGGMEKFNQMSDGFALSRLICLFERQTMAIEEAVSMLRELRDREIEKEVGDEG